MPCLCPPAAPSYAALWITDEVLAAAWRRFTHVYNTTPSQRHRIDGGRRHGSTVPGPLESRRRLAKRRMGLASHSQPSNGGGGDFGALFGFGTRGATRQDVEKGWKYEAPKSQNTGLSAGERAGSVWGLEWPGAKPERKEQEQEPEQEAWERFLQVPFEGREEVGNCSFDGSEVEEVQTDPVLASRNAFEKLLTNLDNVQRLTTDSIVDITAFLQSAADEVEAKNTSRLVKWLGGRDLVTNEVLDLVVEVIVKKIRLDTLPKDECAEVLRMLARTSQPTAPEYTRVHVLLRALQCRELLSEVCTTTTSLLAEEAPAKDDQIAPVIDFWLSCLRLFETNSETPSFDLVWHGVYEQLSLKYNRSAVLRKHLSELNSEVLAMILLHHWVPHVLVDSRIKELVGEASTTGYTMPGKNGEDDQLRLSFSRCVPTDITRLFNAWKISQSMKSRGDYPYSALMDLVAALAHDRLPYAAFACDVFSILSYSSSAENNRILVKAYSKLRFRLTSGVPSALGEQLVDHFLSTDNPRYALKVFRSVPGIPLSKFHALPLAIAEDSSSVPSSAVWYALNRIAPEDYSPRPALLAARQSLILSPSHIDLVHRVAFAFAKQELLPPREAFRRVWECYRFLKDRSAPIGNLLSRALVTAGIIRPLKMGIRVATEQVRFILSVVEKVEGSEVAEQIDRKVLETWMGVVLPELLKSKGSGIDETRTGEGADQWRSVTWARERNGKNRPDHVREGREAVQPELGTADKYEPFAFNDDDGDISVFSPRAGADSWDDSASSTAWSDESASPARPADVWDTFHDPARLNEESLDPDIELSLQPESPIRIGLDYSTPEESEKDEMSTARELDSDPKDASEHSGKQFVTVATNAGQPVTLQSSAEMSQNVVEVSDMTDPAKDVPRLSSDIEMKPGEPFPIYWQEKPCSFEEASLIMRQFKSLHSERPPTVSETSFMQSYHAALGRVFDEGEQIDGAPLAEFPFPWGNTMIYFNIGRAVRLHVLGRASAAGRELNARESAFVNMVNFGKRRRRKASKSGIKETH